MTLPEIEPILTNPESPEVIAKISPNDVMYRTAPEHYLWWGREALWCIDLVLRATRTLDVNRILDLPCGHGRVLRMLRAAWPAAQITACDLDEDAVSFCAETFGATPVVSKRRPQDVELDPPYDLIWCGSLLTHLDHPRWSDFLDLFASVLAPEGILMFTTHGATFANQLRSGELRFAVPRRDDLLARYHHDGFGYYDYPTQEGYGMSLSSAAWVAQLLQGSDALGYEVFLAGGWGSLQDVYGCRRR